MTSSDWGHSDSEPRMQADWRGISAPVSWITTKDYGDGWLAVGTDPQTGQVAVSVWSDTGGLSIRHVALWLDDESAAKLAAALDQKHPLEDDRG